MPILELFKIELDAEFVADMLSIEDIPIKLRIDIGDMSVSDASVGDKRPLKPRRPSV